MDKLYTLKEAAQILRVSRGKIYLMIKAGSINPVKLDRKVLFPESELNRFIEELKEKR
jgi:excisionase family DNA binding protein